jgi:hypothetical protein
MTFLFRTVLLASVIAMPLAAASAQSQTAPQQNQQQPQATQPSEQPQSNQPAQQSPSNQPAEQSQTAQPNEEQLKAFAAATVRIAKIQQQAQQQMMTAAQEEGLSPEQYNNIAKQAQADPKLEQTLNKMIQDQLAKQ